MVPVSIVKFKVEFCSHDMPHDDQRIESALIEEWDNERVEQLRAETYGKEG